METIKLARPSNNKDLTDSRWLEHAHDSLFVLAIIPNSTLIFEAVNRACARNTGRQPADLIGRQPYQCFNLAVANTITENAQRCIQAGTPIQFDSTRLFESQSHWQTILTPIRNADGEITQVLGSAREYSAEISTRESAERNRKLLQCLIDAASDMMYIVDLSAGRFVVLGGSVQKTIGHSAVTIQGWSKDELNATVHPDDITAVRAHRAWTKRMPSDVTAEVEHRVRHADGNYIWLHTRETVFGRDKDGRATTILGVSTSIQKTKDSERLLRLAHIKLRQTLRSITDCYFTLDNNSVITDINYACLEWIGVKREEIEGVCFWDLCKPTDECGGLTKAALETRHSTHGEVKSALRPDRWLDYHAYPSQDGIAVLFHDITERKLAEQDAARSRGLLSATLNALSAHIAILDQQGTIVDANAAWRHSTANDGSFSSTLGIGRNYLTGFRNAVDTEPAGPAIADHIESVINGKRDSLSLEYLCDHRCYQLRANRFENDKRTYVAIAREDITELAIVRESLESVSDDKRRQVSQIFRQSIVNRLSSSIAHELNQPLSAIMFDAATLLIQLEKHQLDEKEIREFATDISNGARRAAEVITRVRQLMNHDTGKFELIDLADLIVATQALLRSELLRRRTILTLNLEPDLAPIRGDVVQLQQIFINLIMNAMEAMESGAATQAHHKIMIEADTKDGNIRTTISDYGPGVPEAIEGALFEPFVTTKSGGLGLGLSICVMIAEAHGGRIILENRPDQGASAILILPIAAK